MPLPVFCDNMPVRSEVSLYATTGKRVIDLVLVLVALPVVAPLLAVILLATWAEGGKPIYRQRRIGVAGREFSCWKVRTMVRNADRALADLIAADPEIAAEWAKNQKLARDPRITRLGRFLRRTSLDELPQLLNVLNGTMSLIGPRPFTPEQRALYADGRDCTYYHLRPGLSGLWQVSRRSAGSFSDRVHFDEIYGQRMSLSFDAGILWRTLSVVLRATGV
jgi:lipopolysaccharide/colanic/teichoic acid biosynthesis glycosyltransferase